VSAEAPAVPPRHWLFWAVSCWLAALAITFAGFVATFHEGPWSARVEPRAIPGAQLQLVRGTVRVEGGAMYLEKPAEDGSIIVSANLEVPIEASDFRIARVRIAGAFPKEGLSLVWRTEKPMKTVPRMPVQSSGGRVLPVTLGAIDGWSGKIIGVGLVSRGPLAGPLLVDRIEFVPTSVWTTIDGMVSDWVEFEPWDGGSIHFMAGGNPSLRHPLPLFLGIAMLVAIGLYLVVIVLGHTRFEPQAALAIALLGWAVVDARWQLNLWKQLDITRYQYAGKSWEEKRRSAEDGRLFEFMTAAKAKIGDAPAHVFVFADDEFDRVRGAYHLYPRNVTVQPKRQSLLPAATFKAGDFLVLYRKRGVQYSPSEKVMRWDATESIRAELVHFSEGSAVFRVLGAA
jgi:hypothetical protein